MNPSLLDTDILSEFLKKRNPHVLRRGANYLAQHNRFTISAITWYEILRGLKDKNALRQLKTFENFCLSNDILPITDEILDRTSDLWVEGRRGGYPRRDPDLIIAATALKYGRSLVTGNTSDFAWIPGLTLENWRDA